jgi:hypothetical protein
MRPLAVALRRGNMGAWRIVACLRQNFGSAAAGCRALGTWCSARGTWCSALGRVAVVGLACFIFAGCGGDDLAEKGAVGQQKVVGNALPPRPVPTEMGAMPAELKLETLSEKEFLGKFRFREKPLDYFIGTDFYEKIDPSLYHFQRVEVVLADGTKTEVRMQYFGAWAIWKNTAGNWEMLTTMTNDHGIMMHFHTLNPRFESLGSFEIARRTQDGEAVTIRRGKFTNDDTYEYTVATRDRGVLQDTVNGLMVVVNSGNYKVLSETSAK